MEKNSLSFCSKFIDDFATQHNLDIEVSTKNDEIILPFAASSEHVIYLSDKCYALLILQTIGEAQKFIELLLSIHMAQNDQYDYFNELIENYSSQLDIDDKSLVQEKVLVQMFVISMHELAHCLFYINKEAKETYYKLADELLTMFNFEDDDDSFSIKDIVNGCVEDKTTSEKLIDYIEQHSDLSNDSLNRSMEKSIENTNKRLPKKEEYAADIFALEIFYETFSLWGLITEESLLDVLGYAFDTFFFLSNFNNIEDKIDLGHNKREVTYRPNVSFDSIRWMVAYATLVNVSEGKFEIDDPLKEKIIPYNKMGYDYILELANRKYDKYLDVTSKGSGIKRNESLYNDASRKLSTVIKNITSQLQ